MVKEKFEKVISKFTSNPQSTAPAAATATNKNAAVAPVQSPVAPASAVAVQSTSGPPSVSKTHPSPRWFQALDRVQAGDKWQKYKAVLAKQQALQLPSASPPNAISPTVPPIVQEIFAVSEAVNTQAIVRSASRRTTDAVLGLVSKVEKLGTTITALNPYASLAWGIVTCFATCLQSHADIQALCLETLPRILSLRERYGFCESIDLTKLTLTEVPITQFKESLTSLYAAILEYQVVILVTLYSRMHKVAEAFGTKSDSDIKAALSEVERSTEQFLELQAILQFELAVKHSMNIRDIHDLLLTSIPQLLATVTNTERIVAAKERREILNWVSPILYANAHNEEKRHAMDQTGQWLFDHADFLAWESSNISTVLWLKGFMGTGKSCLVWKVIERLRATQPTSTRPQPLFAYYYCDKTSNERQQELKDANTVIRCLVKQWCDSHGPTVLPDDLMTLHEKHSQSSSPTQRQCMNLLTLTANARPEGGFLIIDGFDECPVEVQQALLVFLQALRVTVTSSLKVLIASRDEGHSGLLLRSCSPTVIDVAVHTTDDIKAVIRAKVGLAATDARLGERYKRGGNSMKESVLTELKLRANGMFKWVDMALEFLHSSADVLEMKDRLRQLDRLGSLFALYHSIWNANMERLSPSRKKAVVVSLQYILHWRDAIGATNGHLFEFAAIGGLSRETVITKEDIAALMPGFMVVEHRDYSATELMLPHASIYEFLTQKIPCLSPANAYISLSEGCLDLLAALSTEERIDGDSGNPLPAEFDDIADFAVGGWPECLFLAQDASSSDIIIEDILVGHPSLHAKVDGFLFSRKTLTRQNIIAHYTPSWLRTKPDSTLAALLYLGYGLDRINTLTSPIELKDYKFCDPIQDQIAAGPLHWGVAYASASGFEWLLSQGLDVNLMINNGTGTPAHALLDDFVAKKEPLYNFKERCQTLLRAGADFNIRDDDGALPIAQLRYVVTGGRNDGAAFGKLLEDLLELNIDITAPLWESGNESDSEPEREKPRDLLLYAIDLGRNQNVECLLRYFSAKISAPKYWNLCYSEAVGRCQSSTVRLIIEQGHFAGGKPSITDEELESAWRRWRGIDARYSGEDE